MSGSFGKDQNLMQFAKLLCELSKYNSDLKAILENSKSFVDKDNVKISGSKSITADSIYGLLTLQGTIWVDTSKLSEETKRLVNRLVDPNKQEK